MDKVTITLTVFFEEPFWVGVVERTWDGKMAVAKVTFGPEPREYEVFECFLKNYEGLRFSPTVETTHKDMHVNPKRMQRLAHKQIQDTGIGTKSQQALKMQQEQMITERKDFRKEQQEAKKIRLFELKQQKRKEKHRGR